jgi:hypothetical protein
MGVVLPLKSAGAFEPEIVVAMSRAVDGICCTINLPPSATGARTMIARRVIELVRLGERDPARISELVLGNSKFQQ